MRVIAGSAKGRRLRSMRGQAVRPTADRVKEALFSMLGSRYDLAGALILDLYAGSGGVGIEALSRGAAAVTFVERHAATCGVLRENLKLCGFQERAAIICAEARRGLSEVASRSITFDGAFIDPPYGRGLAAATLAQLGNMALLREDGWVVVEHHSDDVLDTVYGRLGLTHSRRYGKTCLSLFQVRSAASAREV